MSFVQWDSFVGEAKSFELSYRVGSGSILAIALQGLMASPQDSMPGPVKAIYRYRFCSEVAVT